MGITASILSWQSLSKWVCLQDDDDDDDEGSEFQPDSDEASESEDDSDLSDAADSGDDEADANDAAASRRRGAYKSNAHQLASGSNVITMN